MHPEYKNTDLLKFHPFYTSEIEITTKKTRVKKNVINKPKTTNKQLSQALPFPPKKTRKFTKPRILENILPFFDAMAISRRECAFRGYAETYNVEAIDNIGLRDSLFLAKPSIKDFLKDMLKEKRGYKYSLLAIITFKKWKAEINAWKFQNIYIRSNAITVTNQRFYLNDTFTKILNLLDVLEGKRSGWIIDQVQNIQININNYDPLVGSSYLQLPTPFRNSMKRLINTKNKDNFFAFCGVMLVCFTHKLKMLAE